MESNEVISHMRIKLLAIFECNTVFFGPHRFKPSDLLFFTETALRICVANAGKKRIKLVIPMTHVVRAQAFFTTTLSSIIFIELTDSCAQSIDELFKTKIAGYEQVTQRENIADNTYLVLVCKNLAEDTENVLRIMFPMFHDIHLEKTRRMLKEICMSTDQLTMEGSTANDTFFSLFNKDETLMTLFSNNKVVTTTDNNGIDEMDIQTGDLTKYIFNELELNGHSTVVGETIDDIANTSNVNDVNKLVNNTVNPKKVQTSSSLNEIESTSKKNADDIDMLEVHAPINDARTILIYPYGGADGAISLSVGDFTCLGINEYLNDKIIDFYLKWIYMNVIKTEEERKRTHIFNSFFYHVLTVKQDANVEETAASPEQRRYLRVKTWTKNVNIFEKDFLIVPINEQSHWYLAIICYPNLVISKENSNIVCTIDLVAEKNKEIIKQPAILLFDSLAGGTNYHVIRNLRDYLNSEYNGKILNHAQENIFTRDSMPGHRVKAPQQDNLTDCGLFLLQYVEEFFANPIKDFRIPIKEYVKWFDIIKVKRKREEIANLIKNLIEEYHNIFGDREKIELPVIRFQKFD